MALTRGHAILVRGAACGCAKSFFWFCVLTTGTSLSTSSGCRAGLCLRRFLKVSFLEELINDRVTWAHNRWDSVFLLRMTPNISRREEARGAHRAMQRKRISFVNYHDKST